LEVERNSIRVSKLLRILQHFKQERIVESYSFIEPRLEDVYIKVTRDETDLMPVQSQNS